MTGPSPDLSPLTDEVTKATTVMAGAKTLINGQATRLRALAQGATDFTALKQGVLAEAARLDAGVEDLSTALVENTGAEGEIPPG